MVDIAKQVAYWQGEAEEDLGVARDLLEKRRPRHCLFFTHLALEKLLKAFVCRQTHDLAPRTHNLPRLAALAQLGLTPEQTDVLADINEFNIEGRYRDPDAPSPSVEEAERHVKRAEELFHWLLPTL